MVFLKIKLKIFVKIFYIHSNNNPSFIYYNLSIYGFPFWNNCSEQVILSYTAFLLAPEERQIQRTEAICLTQFLF